MTLLTLFVNDNAVHECDCDTSLSDEQHSFLDRMDTDMGRGIKIQGQLIPEPDGRQRAQFVALNLVRAFKQENDAGVSVSCAYLCDRLPALREVHVRDHDDGLKVEFVESLQA